jgi:hypothetical protein
MVRLSSVHWDQNALIAPRNVDQMVQRASLAKLIAEMSAVPRYLLVNKTTLKRTN